MEIKHLHLTSPIPPSVNHYLGYRAIIKNGKPMATSYKTTEAKKYQKEFGKYIQEQVARGVAEEEAKKQGFHRIHISTGHTGLYEKYGHIQ